MEQKNREKVKTYLKQIANRDRDALGLIYELIGGRLLSIARKSLPYTDAKDVISEFFCNDIPKIAAKAKQDKNCYGYICKSLKNKIINLSAHIKHDLNFDLIAESSFSCDQDFFTDKSADILLTHEAIKTLNEIERKIIHYTFWEDMTIREISKALKISKSTVHRILKEAFLKMKIAIKDSF